MKSMVQLGPGVALVISLNAATGVAPQDQCDWAAKVSVAEHRRDSQIREIRSVRRYTLHNPRWKSDAKMTVLMIYEPNGSKRYEVLHMEAEGLQKQVLHRILEGEVEVAKEKDDAAITPANYETVPVGYETCGNGRRCLMVELKPRRKSRTLLEGRAWIDIEEAAPVRLEGRPSKSLGFWVGKPQITQDFRKVGSFWLSSRNQSTADVRFVGKTDLTVEFLDYSITPNSGATLLACLHRCSPRLSE